MSHPPQFMDRDFDGGECWWVWIDDKRVTVRDADRWCRDNGVDFHIFGHKHFDGGASGTEQDRFVRWIGFPFEDDALMFYLAHG